jgi:hypothetical protein
MGDLTTEAERKLGQLVKEKYVNTASFGLKNAILVFFGVY